MSFNSIRFNLLNLFRELLVYHHRSLEFRAKFFAAMIAANDQMNEEENEKIYSKLRKISFEIYGHDEKRIELLLRVVKEYVEKIITNKNLGINSLMLDIDKTILRHKRYADKINLNHLRRMQSSDNPQARWIQQRIIEFAQMRIEEIKRYKEEREKKRKEKTSK